MAPRSIDRPSFPRFLNQSSLLFCKMLQRHESGTLRQKTSIKHPCRNDEATSTTHACTNAGKRVWLLLNASCLPPELHDKANWKSRRYYRHDARGLRWGILFKRRVCEQMLYTGGLRASAASIERI